MNEEVVYRAPKKGRERSARVPMRSHEGQAGRRAGGGLVGSKLTASQRTAMCSAPYGLPILLLTPPGRLSYPGRERHAAALVLGRVSSRRSSTKKGGRFKKGAATDLR